MAVSLHLPSAESSKSRVPGVALWKDDERCKTNAQHNSLQRYVEFHILGSSCAGNLCARESHRSEGNAILEEMTQEEQGKKRNAVAMSQHVCPLVTTSIQRTVFLTVN